MSIIANRLITGSGFRTLNFIATVAVAFFMMPFIVHSLGDHWYGFWAFIASLMGYYGYLDLGLATAVSRFVSKHIGGKDFTQMNRVINTAIGIYFALSILSLLITGIIILLSPLFLKQTFNLNTFRICIFIMGLSIAIGLPMRSFSGVLTSYFRYDLIAAQEFLLLLIRTGLILYFLSRGHGIISLALISFFIGILSSIALYWLIKKYCPEVSISIRYFDRSKIKILFNYSSMSFLAQLGDLLRFKIDVVVISYFLGAVAITKYSIASNLVTYFIRFITNLISMMGTVFSLYEGQNNYDAIRKQFMFTTKISVFVSILLGGLFLTCTRPFIVRWMGKNYIEAVPVIYILIPPLMVALMQSPSVNVLYGISKHYYFAIFNIIEGISNFTLSLFLVHQYGIVGVALGTAIPMLIIKIFIQPVYVCKILKINLKSYYFLLFRSSILGFFILMIGFYSLQPLLIPNYLYLIFLCCIVGIVYTIAQFFFLFNSKEKAYFFEYAKRILPYFG